ncbi:chemotaxis protein CheC [Acetitomaculum ruminis DSM 5522]|uniref:Chemotaxis protein CheC n=1 Tax=Acetitomaculum ruminis DSM 5522 TaxID=1120918 RepID=A0A1I0ZLF3_9FIRM|nr:chemotaxis protein CheC [Acetitomaculum ruminis]SFB25350.1 chemotaxis protein CheC [Acetitomaculum ruminis DSM 5522]
MKDLKEINSIYFDVLKEIGNIGAGNAATSLARLLNSKISMQVPKVELLNFSDLAGIIAGEEETVVGILIEVTEDITGSMMFFLQMDSAKHLVNKLVPPSDDTEGVFSEMELSALKEIGNIITGAYLSALSGLTNLKVGASIPYLCIDMAAAILSVPAIEFGMFGDEALLIENQLEDEVLINGYFILLPDPDSYDKILGSLGIHI